MTEAPAQEPPQVEVNEYGHQPTSIKDVLKIQSEGKKAAVEEEPEAPEEPSSSHDDSLREAAKAFGYSDEELEGYSPETLQAEISKLDRRVLQALAQRESERDGHAPPQPPQAPIAAQPNLQQAAPIDWKALENEYDEGIVKPLKSMYERMEAMQSALQSYEQMFYAQQSQDFSRWFDAQLPNLGDGFQSVLGKGTINELNPNSMEYRNRARLEEAFTQLRQIDNHSSDEALFKRAALAAFPEVQAEQARKKLSVELSKRQKSTIGRPAGRKSQVSELDDREPLTGVSRTVIEDLQANINRKLGRVQRRSKKWPAHILPG